LLIFIIFFNKVNKENFGINDDDMNEFIIKITNEDMDAKCESNLNLEYSNEMFIYCNKPDPGEGEISIPVGGINMRYHHINGVTWDNRRKNLQIVTQTLNIAYAYGTVIVARCLRGGGVWSGMCT
jgi:hypothetical protein